MQRLNLRKCPHVWPGWRNSSSTRNRGTESIKEVKGRGRGHSIKCSREPSTMRSRKDSSRLLLLFPVWTTQSEREETRWQKIKEWPSHNKVRIYPLDKRKNRMEAEGERKGKCFCCLLIYYSGDIYIYISIYLYWLRRWEKKERNLMISKNCRGTGIWGRQRPEGERPIVKGVGPTNTHQKRKTTPNKPASTYLEEEGYTDGILRLLGAPLPQ